MRLLCAGSAPGKTGRCYLLPSIPRVPTASLLYVSLIINFLNAKLQPSSYLIILQLLTLLTTPTFLNLFPGPLPLLSPGSLLLYQYAICDIFNVSVSSTPPPVHFFFACSSWMISSTPVCLNMMAYKSSSLLSSFLIHIRCLVNTYC